MIKVISAKVAARRTIRTKLEREIPSINKALEDAMNNGDTTLEYKGKISIPTVKMISKAGYLVEHSDVEEMNTLISWKENYFRSSKNPFEVERIAREATVATAEQ